MKSLYRKLSIVTTIIFIGSILYNAYLMYFFPDALMKANLIDMLDTNKLKPILGKVSIFLGFGAFFGLATIILLIIADKRSTSENIVYVESFKKAKENNLTEQKEGTSDSYDNKIQKVQDIIHEHQHSSQLCCNKVLSFVCKDLESSTAALYLTKSAESRRFIELYASYAFVIPESQSIIYEYGEGLAGQVAKTGEMVNLNSIPNGYIKIFSGLGEASPSNLIIVPLINDNEVHGILEIASFKKFTKQNEEYLTEIFSLLSENIFKKKAIDAEKV